MALSAQTFTSAGGAVSDLFAVDAYHARAKGNRLQAQQYDLAQKLSLENEQFTKTSTAIKEQQAQRGINTVLGQQATDVGAAGFEASGSALDLLRDSAAQGALHRETLGQQGLIEEAGYKEQADSYAIMAQSARLAASADDRAATGALISGIIKGVTSVATLGLK